MQRHITIYETLKRIGDAEPRRLDTWSISLTSGAKQRFYGICLEMSLVFSGREACLQRLCQVHVWVACASDAGPWAASPSGSLVCCPGQGDVFKELPHSLEVVDFSTATSTAPKDVSKVR
jgi:hypothetical protein